MTESELTHLFREAIAWGKVYGTELSESSWDEMRDEQAAEFAKRAASCVGCKPTDTQAAAQKAPGMAVQALAHEIIEALLVDEKDGGYDLTAGMFGANFSSLVRRWAALEHAQAAAQQPVVPEGWKLVPEKATEPMLEAARDVKRRRLLAAVEATQRGEEPNTMGAVMAVQEEWTAMLAFAPPTPDTQVAQDERELIRQVLGFDFGPGELQTVNADDLLRLVSAARSMNRVQAAEPIKCPHCAAAPVMREMLVCPSCGGKLVSRDQVRRNAQAAEHAPCAKLLELADRIDPEQLWRRAGLDRQRMTPEQQDRLDAGVNLRRYADLLGSGGWRLYPPRPGMSFRAGSLEAVVGMARRDEVRRHGAALSVPPAQQPADSAGQAPAGWKLVPVEPTDDMLVAGTEAWHDARSKRPAMEDCEEAAACWRAMLAAAPQPAAPDAQAESSDVSWRKPGPVTADHPIECLVVLTALRQSDGDWFVDEKFLDQDTPLAWMPDTPAIRAAIKQQEQK